METLQNSYIYFVSDFILIFGVILSAFIGLHIKNLAPKWHLRLLNTILALMLLGFLPFLTGFLKTSDSHPAPFFP